jgi:hypothetical protein
MTSATIAQRKVPQAISTSVKRREYPLINVRLVRSYIAYESSHISAPYPRALWYEIASQDRMTKTYTRRTITAHATSPAMRLIFIDPFSRTVTREPNSRMINPFVTYPSQRKSPRMMVAYQARRERRILVINMNIVKIIL